MKKIIAWLLVLALTAAISIGATLAYLTDTDEDVNVMTVGKVKIDQLEYERVNDEASGEDAEVREFHDNKPLYPAVTGKDFDYTPGDTFVDWTQIGKDGYTSEIWNPDNINNELDKMVFVKNKGTYDAYVRTVFAFEAGQYTTLAEFQEMVHLNLNDTDWTWEWAEEPIAIGESSYFVAVATYNDTLESKALTEISLSQIALDKSATNADVEAFGETYQILVKTQAIQADGFDDPATALNDGFGPIITNVGSEEIPEMGVDTDNIPFENDEPTKGMDMKYALHNLDGAVITTKVKTVTYGLTEKYKAIADQYEGVLVDVGQDIPVYAYYVPNGNNYDVYFLADDVIYTPKDSTALFKGMTALTSADCDNLDVSRTENMAEMFRDCTALKQVNVANWNTGNVTDMRNMFRNCKVLPEIDLADWDTSNVTHMGAMFRECKAIKELDTGKWDVGNVTNFTQMFALCDKLEVVNTTDWNISSATTTSWMFAKDTKLHTLDVSKWDTSNVTDMEYMFNNCTQLEVLELGGWNTSKVKSMDHMFASSSQNAGNMKFTELDVSNWDTSNVTEMQCMFYGCGSLTELDLSKWDVSNVTIMTHMFADCFQLKDLNLVGWDTSSLVVMDAIFNDCRALETLDVSTFKTHNNKEFCQVFDNCYNLKTIIGLQNWDTSNGRTFEEMFAGCKSLTQLDLSSFDTRNALDNFKGNADTYDAFVNMFSGVNSLEKLVLSENFDFNGNSDSNKSVSLPSPAAKEGYTAKWQNAETGTAYLASEIPEMTAATYVPYYAYVSQGSTLKNALTYLNADSGSTKIKSKITNVTFGRTEDFAEIANNYTGVLADAEQDAPVYVYYVPNGSNYHVYFLSDDNIYAPANSQNLFASMSALKTVDTANFDVSRMTNMRSIFDYCSSLETVDTSSWDTGNVTRMEYAFYGCSKLTALDVSGWDVGNVTTMDQTFYGCKKLTELDVSNWDMSNVDFLYGTFYQCSGLTKLDTSNWDTGKVTNMSFTFRGCTNLAELDVSGWDVGNVTTFTQTFTDCPNLTRLETGNWDTSSAVTMDKMFYGDFKLEYVDVSNWDVSKVTLFNHMFASPNQNGADMALKSIDVSKWNPVSAVNMGSMFYGCGQLTELDMSGWNMPKLENLTHMCADCHSLQEVNLTGWNTPALITVDAMFNHCISMESIDVADLDTATVRELSQMFDACWSLKTIEGMDRWNTSNVGTFTEMFSGCNSLEVLDLSALDTTGARDNFPTLVSGNYSAFHTMFSSMTSLQKLIVSDKISYYGDGTVSEGNKLVLPSPAAKEGYTALWQNVETGELYKASEIPEKTAATYVAYYEPITNS